MIFKDFLLDDMDNMTHEQLFAFMNAIEFQESKDWYDIKDVYELPYGIVKDIQQDIESGDFDIFAQLEYLKKICDKKLYFFKSVQTCNWLMENIIKLLETEAQVLGGKATQDEIEAGIEEFASLGVYNQIRTLTENDITKIEAVRNTKYVWAFLELVARKKESDFTKNLKEIYQKKAK
jgi:hypothetical protein